MTHTATNMPHAANFARSAMAPEISAGVMTANISWKAAKTRIGIGYSPPLTASLSSMSERPSSLKSPMKPLAFSVPKVSEKPNSTHKGVTMPIVNTLIISMLRTDLERTMPP